MRRTVVLFPLVSKPCHHTMVGAHVGGGDVFVRSDDVVDLIDEGTGQFFELARRQLRRVHTDPAFGTAIRQVHHGGLPCHQTGQRPSLVQVDVGMVAETTLHRPAMIVMLDPKPDEVRQPSVVAFDRDTHLDLAAWRQQRFSHFSTDIQMLGGNVEVVLGRLKSSHR